MEEEKKQERRKKHQPPATKNDFLTKVDFFSLHKLCIPTSSRIDAHHTKALSVQGKKEKKQEEETAQHSQPKTTFRPEAYFSTALSREKKSTPRRKGISTGKGEEEGEKIEGAE